jgi:SAM-dependent methyltransferase
MRLNKIKYPYYRELLNRNLRNVSHLLKGIVIDIGGERNPTGGFSLPQISGSYITLNIDIKYQPDIVSNAASLPIKTASVDSVLLMEVLEHVLEPELVISEISRVLKEKGYLIFSMPFLFKIHAAPFDFQRYTSSKIENMFQRNNLEIIQLEITGCFFTTMYDLWKTALAKARKHIVIFCILLPLGLLSLIFLRCLVFLERTKIKTNELIMSYPTGYFVIARKKG